MTSNVSELLVRASSIELQVAAIYDLLADRFGDNATLARFWALFAEAERYHSLLIQMQRMTMEGASSDPERLTAWEGEIDQTHQWLETLHTRLTSGGWKPTVDEAFSLAQDIESRSLEVQSRSFALFESPLIKDLVVQLHTEDMQHRNKLAQARSRFTQAQA